MQQLTDIDVQPRTNTTSKQPCEAACSLEKLVWQHVCDVVRADGICVAIVELDNYMQPRK